MGAGKEGAKIEVNDYHMSLHLGCCVGADALTEIQIGEKTAWKGVVSTQQPIYIEQRDLFGGNKKEGGVAGIVHVLPGKQDQVLSDFLATKLGRSSGADCPGFRGLASLFFTGDHGTVSAGVTGTGWLATLLFRAVGKGFYWSSNNPYLRSTWTRWRRAPKGLNGAYASISRLGVEEFPYEDQVHANADWNTPRFSTDGRYMLLDKVGGGFRVWDLKSRAVISEATLLNPTGTATVEGNWAIDSDGIIWATGNPSPAEFNQRYLWGFSSDGQTLLKTIQLKDEFDDWQYLSGPHVVDSGDKELIVVGPAFSFAHFAIVDPSQSTVRFIDTLTEFGTAFTPFGYTGDGDGAIWTCGIVGNVAHFYNSGADDYFTCDLGEAPGAAALRYFRDDVDDHLVIFGSSKMFFVDRITHALKFTAPFSGWDVNEVVPPQPLTAHSIYVAGGDAELREYSLKDGSLIRSIAAFDFIGGPGGMGTDGAYDAMNHAWVDFLPGTGYRWYFLDRGEFDANPAHMIYECLTNTEWGMGAPSSIIDETSFENSGITLFNERFGLSMIWTRQTTIEAFVSEVLDHIQATLFVNPRTGLLTLKLIRADYDVNTLRILTPDNADLSNFQRKSWGEITNEIIVTWTNPENEQDETVTVQDLAGIAAQNGQIISNGRNYYGVRNPELAMRLAVRDLRVSSAPLASCDAEVNRTGWDLLPGEVVKVFWPEHGLNNVVMRVMPVDYGKPGAPDVKVALTEDIFSLTTADYTIPPGSAWEDTSLFPDAMDFARVVTVPSFIQQRLLAVSGKTAAYPEVFAGILAASDNPDAYNYELYGPVVQPDGATVYQSLATNSILGRATLTNPLAAEANSTAVAYSAFIGQVTAKSNVFVFIGSDATAEDAMEIALITSTGLMRGVLDTVPRAWAAGTPVWFVSLESNIVDPDLKSDGETVRYQLLTRTSLGLLSPVGASTISGTLSDRPWLPNRPANVAIDGVKFNTSATPVDKIGAPHVTVSWANRNRLLEDSQVLAWADGTITPETGQTTTVEVLTADGLTVLATHSGLAGTSFNIPMGSFGAEGITLVRVSASRTDADGTAESLMGHGIYVLANDVVGYGYGYGENYGGL